MPEYESAIIPYSEEQLRQFQDSYLHALRVYNTSEKAINQTRALGREVSPELEERTLAPIREKIEDLKQKLGQ